MIFIITGTSGGGKDSVVNALLQKDQLLYRVITHNSRPKRPEEKEGVDYYFVSEDEFKQLIQDEAFIEWAEVYGQLKGISKHEITRGIQSGKDVLLRINIDGVESIKKLYPEAVSIFITAPSEEEVIQRLHKRGTDHEDDKQIRINDMEREHAYAQKCDHIVYNVTGKFESTVNEVEDILQRYRHR